MTKDGVKELLGYLYRNETLPSRFLGAEVRMSDVMAVIGASLAADPVFPPKALPQELGDGAIVERRGRFRYVVYDRYETGQMQFSDVSTHSYLTLRGAVGRYLKHYRAHFKVHKVRIRWF